MRLPKITASRMRRWFLVRLVANGIAQAGLTIAVALLVREAFSLLTPGAADLSSRLSATMAALVATAALMGWLRRLEHVDADRLGQGYVHRVRVRLFRHLTHVPRRTLERLGQGAVLLRFVGDLTALQMWTSRGVARLVVGGPMLALSLVVLAVIEPAIGLSVTSAVIVAGCLGLSLGPRLKETSRNARRQRARLASRLNDRIGNLGVVDAFDQNDREVRNVSRLSNHLRRAMIERAVAVGAMRAISEATAVITQATALAVGILAVVAGGSGPESVVAAMVVAGLLTPRLKALGRVYEYALNASVARGKLEAFLALPRRRRRGREIADLQTVPCVLSLDTVSLAPALNEVSVDVSPGQRIALVGPNGSGKTSLLLMMAGLQKPDAGQVRLAGTDLRRLAPSDVRQIFALSGPDFPLLRGSLNMNLTYGATVVDPVERSRLFSLCGIDDISAQLGGTHARIFDGAANLSAGERARISLCRALMRQPRILLLDEADANLDPRSIEIIEEVLANFDGTIVYATHSLRLLNRADWAWHLYSGRLVESGTPAGLLGADGPTRSLFSLNVIEAA